MAGRYEWSRCNQTTLNISVYLKKKVCSYKLLVSEFLGPRKTSDMVRQLLYISYCIRPFYTMSYHKIRVVKIHVHPGLSMPCSIVHVLQLTTSVRDHWYSFTTTSVKRSPTTLNFIKTTSQVILVKLSFTSVQRSQPTLNFIKTSGQLKLVELSFGSSVHNWRIEARFSAFQ